MPDLTFHATTMRALSAIVVVFLFASSAVADDRPEAERPNIIVVYADDLGYGDLGCYGHPTLRTPHLDLMAAEGMRFTQFYSAASVCTPSRAALLTGRLPIRSGMSSDRRRVLFPNSGGGIPADEVLMSEILKERGYATACIGKWHLGHLEQYLPTSNGFDRYFGIPYSNDMDRTGEAPKGRQAFLKPEVKFWNVPLMRDAKIVERPADQRTITKRYTDEAVAFIEEHKRGPFFLYMPHTMPHVPLFRSSEFRNSSPRGLYGDVVEEIDASVGRVLDTLRELKIDDDTLVWFSSDNGPWLIFNEQGGSAGLLRDGKGSTWEGGMRVPGLAWWPGKIKSGVLTQQLGSTMDVYTTSILLAGGKPPADRVVDGVDLRPVLFGTGNSPRDVMFYYRGSRLMAVRKGAFKAHFITQSAYGGKSPEEHDPPVLYNLEVDPSEKFNVADRHEDVVADIREVVTEHRRDLKTPPSQLEIPLQQ